MTDVISNSGFPRAGLFRRLAVIVYDLLVVVAIALLANIVALGILQIFVSTGVIDLQNAPDIAAYIQANPVLHFILRCYLCTCICYFYIWFWSHGGQTVGMKAWRLRVQNINGQDISQKQAFIRLLTSAFGLGNFAVFLDPQNKLALQDRAAKCEVVQLTKEANQHKNWQKMY